MAKDRKNGMLVLLDGNALVHRAYHALPPLTNKDGQATGAVYGVAMTLLSVLEKFHPEYIAASFDLAAPTFRHEAYADYKGTRQKAPDDLYEQIPIVKDLVRAFNIPIYEKEGYEADDCVGTIARQAAGQGIPTVIVTGDNDALQLVSPLIKVFALRKGIRDIVLYDEAAVLAKYGFPASALPDYKGLAGDASDNIPGVAGIGAKTATDLLAEYGSLERVYEGLDSVKESVRKKLAADREAAFFSKKLGTIDTAAPVSFDAAACVAKDFDASVVSDFFRRMGFHSLLKRIPGGELTTNNSQLTTGKTGTKRKKAKALKTVEEIETFLKETNGGLVAVHLVSGEESLFGGAGIASVELSSGKETVSVEWSGTGKASLSVFLADVGRPKAFFDAKTVWHALDAEGVSLAGISCDVMIAGYLLSAGSRVELGGLLSEEFPDEAFPNVADGILRLVGRLREKMDTVSAEQDGKWTLSRLFTEVEMPLIPTLARMEKSGIRLDTAVFRTLSDGLGKELKSVEKRIYDLAGREFNVNSPKQLAEVLFSDLGIPTTGLKKTKTGVSTASSELEKLREYPIVTLIEEERELFKLKTTYLDAFPARVDVSSRLHTTFQQAVTATGRLSSIDPNLQNIPASEKWSKAIRGAFVAEKGCLLAGLDYSQIELRVMAHVSGDEELTRAFRAGEDIHRATAALVFSVVPESVTPDMRRQAKVFNFGIMYGMSAYGLSQRLGMPVDEAATFIENYFERFAGVARYMESTKASAAERGYVETELGRRRYVPELLSSNRALVSAGERMAINMPIQGLAADIMKLAMLRVAEILPEYCDRARILLQVHDELVFEVAEDIAEGFAARARGAMEAAYELSVPLIVEAKVGGNWGELK
ncbi:MAG: DNA polymerase I [Candidatus Moranbacteria bacterium]|nr:DNA polymerase I [Candidatus Moranbacteria bacterium]